MNMKKLSTYLSLLVLSMALVACTTQVAEVDQPSTTEAMKLPVDVKVVRNLPIIQEETVAGSILATREVTIMSEVSRKVTGIHFQDGQVVKKGQLLYKLDDAEVLARMKQVDAELSLAKLNESRLAELLLNESVRQEEYDVAYAKLHSLLAAEELLSAEHAKTSIQAPFSGVIGITKAEVGSLVSPGTPLVNLQEQGQVKITFEVSEKYITKVKNGTKVSFITTTENEKQTAYVIATEPGINALSRSITVHAIADNKSGTLRAGMSAQVYFSTIEEGTKGIRLPTESLIPSAQGYSVFVVKNGVAKISPVSIGNRTESDALITSGLVDGDTVMISNILRTGEGTPVQVVTSK